jgi:hypothetical protein
MIKDSKYRTQNESNMLTLVPGEVFGAEECFKKPKQ